MIGEWSTIGTRTLIGRLYDVRAGVRPGGLTTRQHTDLYLKSDFILMCISDMVKTKEIQVLSLSEKIIPFLEKIPVPPIA